MRSTRAVVQEVTLGEGMGTNLDKNSVLDQGKGHSNNKKHCDEEKGKAAARPYA